MHNEKTSRRVAIGWIDFVRLSYKIVTNVTRTTCYLCPRSLSDSTDHIVYDSYADFIKLLVPRIPKKIIYFTIS